MRHLYSIIALTLLLCSATSHAQQWERLSDVGWGDKIITLRTDPVTIFVGDRRSTDGGATWEHMDTDPVFQPERILAVHPFDTTTVYAKGIRKSDDTELILASYDAGVTFTETSFPSDINFLSVSPTSPVTFVGEEKRISSGYGMYRPYPYHVSKDGGLTWNSKVFGLASPGLHKQNVQPGVLIHDVLNYFSFHPHIPGLFFEKNAYAAYYTDSGVWLQSGSHFARGNINSVNPKDSIHGWVGEWIVARRFDYSRYSGDTISFASHSGAAISIDQGNSWTRLHFDTLTMRGVLPDSKTGKLFCYTDDDGVWWSDDFGLSWEPKNTGIILLRVQDLHSAHNLDVYALTTEGLYVWDPTPIGIQHPPSTVSSLELSQNYPNPFHESTNIQYTLPAAGHVRLTVYDLYGREVAALVDGDRPQGMSSAEFQASGLPPGMYFYSLTTGSSKLTRKMVVGE